MRCRCLFAPVLLFALTLAALQWMNGGLDPRLPLGTVAVFLVSTALVRRLPAPGAGACAPGSRWRAPILFLLFVRHFAAILMGETRRTYQARALCGAGSLSSLAWATAAVFRRSLDRAERFYAARLLSGFPE